MPALGWVSLPRVRACACVRVRVRKQPSIIIMLLNSCCYDKKNSSESFHVFQLLWDSLTLNLSAYKAASTGSTRPHVHAEQQGVMGTRGVCLSARAWRETQQTCLREQREHPLHVLFEVHHHSRGIIMVEVSSCRSPPPTQHIFNSSSNPFVNSFLSLIHSLCTTFHSTLVRSRPQP